MKRNYHVIKWANAGEKINGSYLKEGRWFMYQADDPDQIWHMGSLYKAGKLADAIMDAMKHTLRSFKPLNFDDAESVQNHVFHDMEYIIVYNKNGMRDPSQGEEWDNRKREAA